MGRLREAASGREWPLAANTIVGRSPECGVRPEGATVSGIHAILCFESGGWWLREAGSRNGTWVQGERLAPGGRAELREGMAVSFGQADAPFVLVSAAAPTALARSAAGLVVEAVGGLLALPPGGAPEAVVFAEADGGWHVEGAEGARPVVSGAVILAAGESWALLLPGGSPATALPPSSPAPERPRLAVRHSRDEEYVELSVLRGPAREVLPPRAHAALILTLARAWLDDAGDPPAERGWRYADELARGLGLDKAWFNLHVFRARHQLAEAGVAGINQGVERRTPTGQVRLAVPDVLVGPLE